MFKVNNKNTRMTSVLKSKGRERLILQATFFRMVHIMLDLKKYNPRIMTFVGEKPLFYRNHIP